MQRGSGIGLHIKSNTNMKRRSLSDLLSFVTSRQIEARSDPCLLKVLHASHGQEPIRAEIDAMISWLDHNIQHSNTVSSGSYEGMPNLFMLRRSSKNSHSFIYLNIIPLSTPKIQFQNISVFLFL